jgi:hypothetical protein
MKRDRIFILSLGVTALAALIIAIGLASANSDDGAGQKDQPQAAAPTQPPTRGADQPSQPPIALPSVTPPPTPTRSPETPASGQASPPAATIGPDSPVRSGLPPTTPPGSTAPAQPAPAQPVAPPPGTQIVPAPIDKIDVLIRESFPPQYGLEIIAGLPSGCAKPYSHEMTRQGNVIRVTILNTTVTAGICTLVYGMYEVNFDLGSDFQAGVTYTVHVNDKVHTFIGQ